MKNNFCEHFSTFSISDKFANDLHFSDIFLFPSTPLGSLNFAI